MPNSLFTTLSQNARDLLLGRCAVCGKNVDTPVCRACLIAINKAEHRCNVCAKSVPNHVDKCKDCIETPPAYDHVSYIGEYAEPLSTLITAAKLGRQVAAINALHHVVHTFADELTLPDGDAVLLPMPSPRSRLMTRGFNLPLLLAKPLAKRLQLPILPPTTVTLPFFVPKQAKLSRKQRQKNRHFYQIHAKLPKKIIIFDDIVTTGATVDELSKILRRNHVQSVAVWAISRAEQH